MIRLKAMLLGLGIIYSCTVPQSIGGVLQVKYFQSEAAGRLPKPILSLTCVSLLAALKARNLKYYTVKFISILNYPFYYITVSLR